MIDPVALATAATPHDAAASAPLSTPRAADPVESRMFFSMVQGGAQPDTPAGPTDLRSAVVSYAQQINGKGPSIDEVRHSMMEAVDSSDPIKTLYMLTDHSAQLQTMFTKLHIATGLASAATSVFGNLLKNQQ